MFDETKETNYFSFDNATSKVNKFFFIRTPNIIIYL